jgi:hypothetical protein
MTESNENVRIVLPALDVVVTPEIVSQINMALPQLAHIANGMGLPIIGHIEEHAEDLIPRQVLRLEVGERDELGKISGISFPIITRYYERVEVTEDTP